MGVYYPRAVCSIKALLNDYGVSGFRQPAPFKTQPIGCNVRINNYSEANTFNVVLRWEDFPFDPRLIKEAVVTISIFDLKKLQYVSNIRDGIDEKNVIIGGFVDSYGVTLDETSREISLEGRDYTSIFLNTKFDNANLDDEDGKRKRKISLARPLKAIIQDLINNVPNAGNITIDDRTKGEITNVAVASPGFTLLNGQETTDGMNTYVQKNENYWDVIQGLCESVGVICYIELNNLVLTNPRILYHGEGFSTKVSLPFIYGNNIKRLTFNRNLGKKKRFNIIMQSWDIKTNTPIKVSIPRDATDAWSKETKIQKAVQKIQTLDANGTTVEKDAPAFLFPYQRKTREQLIILGQSIFEEIIRQQLEGDFETNEMAVNDSNGVEFDVSKIKIGTPIMLEITQQDISYIGRKTEDGNFISDGKRIAYLIRRGYSKSTAQILIDAVAKTSGKIRPVFYLRGADIKMNQDGFSLVGYIVNYIELGSIAQGKLVSG